MRAAGPAAEDRTHREHVYIVGRHREKGLRAGRRSDRRDSALLTQRADSLLLPIWPLGGNTPSLLEGDAAAARAVRLYSDLLRRIRARRRYHRRRILADYLHY